MFLKEKLKEGMCVVLRRGEICILCDNGIFYEMGKGKKVSNIVNYDENLKNKVYRGFDILEVYKNYMLTDLMWKRKEFGTSEDERIILRNVLKKYKFLARDKDGGLYAYVDKPFKMGDNWFGDGNVNASLKVFEHLFEFITWQDEEAFEIKELLEIDETF